jgi:hypothetical protein
MDSSVVHKIDNYKIYGYTKKLFDSFQFHTSPIRAERERSLLKASFKQVEKSKSVAYLLKFNDISLGFIALSVTSVNEFPSLQIDYLFVSNQYRKEKLSYLEDNTVSEYLIILSTHIANEIKEKVGLKYLVLYPDQQNKNLIARYKKIGFKVLNKEWMFIKL